VSSTSSHAADPARIAALQRAVLRWFREHGRDLPWRRSGKPYEVLVSEIMLQQTQVARVEPKYRSFLARFPSPRALARAPLAEVLREWSGLGYNSRARRLWECAKAIVSRHGACVPAGAEALRTLPGIGRYTAGAVASFAFGAREPVVDVNVRRVLSRALLGREGTDEPTSWSIAEQALPRRNAAAWSQALMDVGALYCRTTPKCEVCPARRACAFAGREDVARAGARRAKQRDLARQRTARARERFVGSRRYYRGRVVRALTRATSLRFAVLGQQVKDGFATTDLPWLRELLSDLEREGLIALDLRGGRAALP
jgi:A/G-specific adenine glycosylase